MTDNIVLPELFTCEKRNVRLTPAGCGRMFVSANDPKNRPHTSEGRHACLACKVGALNAGVKISDVAEAVEDLRTVCPRCLKRSDRLVGKNLCIGCYNRHAECFRRRPDGGLGRNAKGGRPLLCDVLHTERLAVVDADGERVVEDDHVVSAAETVMRLAKKAKAPMSFARAVPAWWEPVRAGWIPPPPIRGLWWRLLLAGTAVSPVPINPPAEMLAA